MKRGGSKRYNLKTARNINSAFLVTQPSFAQYALPAKLANLAGVKKIKVPLANFDEFLLPSFYPFTL